MSSFQFGKFIYDQDHSNLFGRAKFIYGKEGLVQGGLFGLGALAAATAPLEAVIAPVATVATALYGAKQVYEGIKSIF